MELSRYIFFSLKHGADYRLEVLDKTAYRSPLTQGGLEIKASVTVVWTDEEKFGILRDYISENFSFERRLNDDSTSILNEIMTRIRLDDEQLVISNEEDGDEEFEDNIFMIVDWFEMPIELT